MAQLQLDYLGTCTFTYALIHVFLSLCQTYPQKCEEQVILLLYNTHFNPQGNKSYEKQSLYKAKYYFSMQQKLLKSVQKMIVNFYISK